MCSGMEAIMDDIKKMLEEFTARITEREHMLENGNLPNKSDLAEVYLHRAATYVQSNLLQEGHDDAGRTIVLLEQMLKEGSQTDENMLSKAYYMRGVSKVMMGNPELAMPDINKGIEIMTQIKERGLYVDEETLSDLIEMRANLAVMSDEFSQDAITHYGKIIEEAEHLQKIGQPFDAENLADAYMTLAISYRSIDISESMKNITKCINLLQGMYNNNTQEDVQFLKDLSAAYMRRGENYAVMQEFGQALNDFDKSIEIEEKLLKMGEIIGAFDIMDTSQVYASRGEAHVMVGSSIETVLSDYNMALSILKNVLSEIPQSQEMYFEYMRDLIHLIVLEEHDELLSVVLQEYFFPVQPETEEAEDVKKRIIELLGTSRYLSEMKKYSG